VILKTPRFQSAKSLLSVASGGAVCVGMAMPSPANAHRTRDGGVRDSHFAPALERAGMLMLLTVVWISLHALKWAGKSPF